MSKKTHLKNLERARAKRKANKPKPEMIVAKGTGVKFYPKESLIGDMGAGAMFFTPEGYDTTVEGLTGLMNFRIFGPTGDTALLSRSTNKCSNYVVHVRDNDDKRMDEYLVTLGHRNGSQVDIFYTGKESDGQAIVEQFMSSQTPDITKALGKSFGLAQQDVAMTVERSPIQIGVA